ncbi:MAG: hypothetical protein H7834_15130 [Magnetococcus sp. YQC-9]
MRRTKSIELAGITITVRELPLAELRVWFKSLDETWADPITDGLFESASLRDVARMTDLELEAMDVLLPSEIEALLAVCRELNPHFFQLRARLRTAMLEVAQTARPA